MKPLSFAAVILFLTALPTPVRAQHAQVSAVAVQPGNPNRVWVCNRDNGTVSVIDTSNRSIVAEIPVGVFPRSLAFTPDGSRVFVANQRGNVPLTVNFVTPFTGSEQRGTVTVIDATSLGVTTTLTNVGTEPYGVAVAPNGKYFAVSGFRSGTIKFYDTTTLAEVLSFQYPRNLNAIQPPFTMADVDANRDGIADAGEPRGFVIRADSQRLYVTHFRSPYVTVLDLLMEVSGVPAAVTMTAKINTDEYPYDPIFNPVPVTTIESQGKPRFLEDIALSPDGTRALIPHVLHNVNHDVNHNFGPGFPGAFANRVYPALTMIDAANLSYAESGDASNRLHNELSDPTAPAQYVPYGRPRISANGNVLTLGGEGSPVAGGTATLVLEGMHRSESARLLMGPVTNEMVLKNAGILLVRPQLSVPMVGNHISLPLASTPAGTVIYCQALVTNNRTGQQSLSTGLRIVVNASGFGQNKMGYRAGQPSRVVFNASGNRALMLNRGSEDLFLYKVTGSDMELLCVFPPRHNFTARAPLDTSTPMGDLPLGMTMVADTSTPDPEDALVYVINEVTRTLSTFRVHFLSGTIHRVGEQIPTHQGPDAFTPSQLKGEEIFEDASRLQTTKLFNNSCGSCHFEGGDDGNVWQRTNGPRSTMPMYGGLMGTGLILWKGARLNNGETGPMFGGENGGHGIFSNADQQALTDFHQILPVPLNPNLDPITGAYSPTAALGKDLYFGTNDTGLNPTLRHAGCAVCHPDFESNPGNNPGPRFYTADVISSVLGTSEMLGTIDPNCFSLRENIVAVNLRNVNTGCNVDVDHNGFADPDRNGDGYSDLETFAIMNSDKDDDFNRDDGNSYLCPCDPQVDQNCPINNPFRVFTRSMLAFSIPTKLGVFSTGPYFHDHSTFSLRALLDPDVQALSPVYGSPAFPSLPPYPGINKIFNDVHDVRGHEFFVQGASKVQLTLVSTNVDDDIEAILAYIQSL